MAVTFVITERTVNDPIDGVRPWSATLTGTDFNTGTVYDNAVTTKANPLLEHLREYGPNLLIRELNLRYVGDAVGMAVTPRINTSANGIASLNKKLTAYATDQLSWPGLYIPVRFGPAIYHYLVSIAVATGYAATDDMVVDLHGEVW